MLQEKTGVLLKTSLILLALTIATLAVYWQVQYHEFINFDDPIYVADNPMVRTGLSWEGFCWAFRSTMAANWHPVTWLSHMLDSQLFGKRPAGHHLTNLFFHLANTLLLFLILKEMTSSCWRSAFVAAMFALHPLHVESVAWVAERKDVLSVFFLLLTLATYCDYLKRPGKMKYLAALFFYILGLMAKPMLVTLPFVLILLDFWPLRQFSASKIKSYRLFWPTMRPIIIGKIPFFACSLISSVITYHVQNKEGAVSSLRIIPVGVRVSNSFISYVEYINKTIWPRDLAVFYPYPDTIFLSKVLGAALVILFVSVFAVYSVKRFPYVFVGWFWYLGTLVPVVGLVQVGAQSLADRYTYLPLIGLFIIIAWGAREITRWMPGQRIILTVCALLLLAHWTFASWRQTSYWKNNITLFQHAISVTRDNVVAHTNLGHGFDKEGKEEEAMRQYQEALRINPADPFALSSAGSLLLRQGRTDEAIDYFRRALKINRRLPAAHISLGSQLAKTPEGQSEAEQHFVEALKIDPFSSAAHYQFGLLLLSQRKTEDAIVHLEDAVRLNPDFVLARHLLGAIYNLKKTH